MHHSGMSILYNTKVNRKLPVPVRGKKPSTHFFFLIGFCVLDSSGLLCLLIALSRKKWKLIDLGEPTTTSSSLHASDSTGIKTSMNCGLAEIFVWGQELEAETQNFKSLYGVFFSKLPAKVYLSDLSKH